MTADSAEYFELWIDRCAPGQSSASLEDVGSREQVREVNSTEGRRSLQAVWTTEFGELDQVLSLWRLSGGATSADEHAGQRFARERRLMRLAFPYDAEFTGGHIYDMRRYTLREGTLGAFLRAMGAALPARKALSRNVGVWVDSTEPADQIVHVWAYRDMDERRRAREASAASPAWQAYLSEIFPLVSRMQNALLVPAPVSPMQ